MRKSRFGEKWAFLNQCTSVTLYVSNHKIRDASNISKYRLLQRWNRFINAPNQWKYQTRTATTDLWEKRGKGDEVLELPIGILQNDTSQVVGNKRTHPIRTLSRNNNSTTGLKRGPNPLSGVLIPKPWEVVIVSFPWVHQVPRLQRGPNPLSGILIPRPLGTTTTRKVSSLLPW